MPKFLIVALTVVYCKGCNITGIYRNDPFFVFCSFAKMPNNSFTNCKFFSEMYRVQSCKTLICLENLILARKYFLFLIMNLFSGVHQVSEKTNIFGINI